jgi:hypothetical protein
MSCTRINLRSLGRKKYPLVRQNTPRLVYLSKTDFEIESIIVDILESDSVTVTFDKPFTATPSVVAAVITQDPVGGANAFVETVTPNFAVIRTSAPTTAKIHVHAMWIEGCDA